jgi:hypothetical protein
MTLFVPRIVGFIVLMRLFSMPAFISGMGGAMLVREAE